MYFPSRVLSNGLAYPSHLDRAGTTLLLLLDGPQTERLARSGEGGWGHQHVIPLADVSGPVRTRVR